MLLNKQVRARCFLSKSGGYNCCALQRMRSWRFACACLKQTCCVGPLANSALHMMGSYYGKIDADIAATPLQGIQEELGECC